MVADCDEGYIEFVKYHEPQLRNIGLPEGAWRQAYEKLQPHMVYDLESFLAAEDGVAVAQRSFTPYSHIFVVPHIFTGDGGQNMYSNLEQDTEQPQKLRSLLRLEEKPLNSSDERRAGIETVSKVAGCSDVAAAEAYKKVNGDVILAIANILSLNTDAADTEALLDALNISQKKKEILTYAEFKSALTDELPEAKVEAMYTDYKLKKQQEFGEDGHGTTLTYSWEDDPEEQVITVRIPVPRETKRSDVVSRVTSREWCFGIKGQPPLIQGSFPGTVVPDECTWYFEKNTGHIIASIQKSETEVFLWPCLIKDEERIKPSLVISERNRKILSTMEQFWFKALTYQPVTTDGAQSYTWYLPPALVGSMPHSDKPKFKLSPFWSCYGGKICTLVWPIANVKQGDRCTLNRFPVLLADEPASQRFARVWCCDSTMTNMGKEIPDNMTKEYECLRPPHSFTPSSNFSLPADEDVIDANKECLRIGTPAFFSQSEKEKLQSYGIELVEIGESENIWMEGDGNREGYTNINTFNSNLTNLIKLNQYIRTNFGKADFWEGGYHINKELAALVADPEVPPWQRLWVLRCAAEFGVTVVTSNLARVARLCENSLTYFAQPYIESILLDNCACSLEYTVVIKNKCCWISDIPAVHKARQPKEGNEFTYCNDFYIPRSDKAHTSTTPWPKYMVEFSVKSPKSWPAQEAEIFSVFYSFLKNVVSRDSGLQCYGIHVIITPELKMKIVGVNSTPTYFPSLKHVAAAWKMLYRDGNETYEGFKRLI